jgi:hypothetical protein
MCNGPVGLGANLTLTFLSLIVIGLATKLQFICYILMVLIEIMVVKLPSNCNVLLIIF